MSSVCQAKPIQPQPLPSLLPELRRPRSEPSSYYSSESQKEYPAPKKHKLNPDYSTRQEKLLSTALSLEQPSICKPSSGAKQTLPETISPRHVVRDYARELVSDLAGYRGSGGQAGVKWSPKEAYIGVSAVQVSGSPKGLVLGKESGAQRLHQREQMNVLMMTDREMGDSELLSFRDSTESEDCLHHVDDLQVCALWGVGRESVHHRSCTQETSPPFICY